MDICVIDGCDKPVYVKKYGWCTTHYGRFHKHGDPLAWKRPTRPTCSVDGCDLNSVAHQLCDLHYRRQKRYGTTEAPERPTVCAVEACGRGVDALGLCDKHYRRVLNGLDPDRRCTFCGQSIDPNAHMQRRYCSAECKEQEEYFRRRASHRANWLKKYGMTVEDYDRMRAEQADRCFICHTDEPKTNGKAHWCVDHCHATGAVRGLLCSECNQGLGKFKDDPALLRAAADYLERPVS